MTPDEFPEDPMAFQDDGGDPNGFALHYQLIDAEALLIRAKAEPCHSPTEDALIDAVKLLVCAVRILAGERNV